MRICFKGLRCAILLSVLGFTACSEPEPIVVYGVTLETNSVVFDSAGGQKIISVLPFPEDEVWKLEGSAASWADVREGDKAVWVGVEENTSTEVRTTSFSIVSPEGRFEPRVVEVCQEATPKVSLSTSVDNGASYIFDSEGGQMSFTVICSTDEWSVRCEGAEWIAIDYDTTSGRVTLTAERNTADSMREGFIFVEAGKGESGESVCFFVVQDTRANNPYYKLVGEWEITASKWFYSPNGSLNSLDYAPSPTDYYLVFSLEEGVYGESLVMKDFLYPGTELEVRYDSSTGGFVIPFGWTVLSYDVFFYITVVNERQFSYASLEVDVLPSAEGESLTPQMPSVDGFQWVGFGLWTYDDNGNMVALGSTYRPTMFPMGDIVFRKQLINEEE